LSPKPASPFPIAAEGKATFTFSSSKPGAYSVFFGGNSSSAPSSFPAGISEELLLEVGSPSEPPPPFDNEVKGGS
jgi:hypothetical protein